jgi:archaellum biogenesis protein FlaJ (TadC family)
MVMRALARMFSAFIRALAQIEAKLRCLTVAICTLARMFSAFIRALAQIEAKSRCLTVAMRALARMFSAFIRALARIEAKSCCFTLIPYNGEALHRVKDAVFVNRGIGSGRGHIRDVGLLRR